MKLIHKLVVPKISSHWESVAASLQLDGAHIEVVEQRCRGEPRKCCVDMIENWISSDKGLSPKTWPVLLQAISRTSPELVVVASDIKEALIKQP